MLTIERLRETEGEEYRYAEKLLTDTFPVDEYRDLETQRKNTAEKTIFHNHILKEDGKPIGLLSYWDLGAFIYVEHFATDPAVRNGGYGKRVLNLLRESTDKSIVLEVELPTDEFSTRRINFYQRLGYNLWERTYIQPPYKAGCCEIPMYLMVNGDLTAPDDFDRVKEKIHSEVYGVK